MHNFKIVLRVLFYQESSGNEPVKKWLYELDKQDRKVIGESIKRVQYGWPLGMPLVRSLGKGLWELRISLDTRIARIIFILFSGDIILLHGFIKKSQKTPISDIDLARKRAQNLNKGKI